MSCLYDQKDPPIKGLKNCPKCETNLEQDIFQVQTEKKKKLMEAICCHYCNIIYEVITE